MGAALPGSRLSPSPIDSRRDLFASEGNSRIEPQRAASRQQTRKRGRDRDNSTHAGQCQHIGWSRVDQHACEQPAQPHARGTARETNVRRNDLMARSPNDQITR